LFSQSFYPKTGVHRRVKPAGMLFGKLCLGDRVYMQPDWIAALLEAGADIVVRSGWRNARWLDADGAPVNLLTEFENAKDCGPAGKPIWTRNKAGRDNMSASCLMLAPMRGGGDPVFSALCYCFYE
jgi:hypothetical protein